MRDIVRRCKGVGAETRALARDSGLVAIAQTANGIVQFLIVLVVTRTLGLTGYGRFALVTGFVILVGQFFDVRVTNAAITFGAKWLDKDLSRVAGIVSFSYAVDLVTGIVGFVVTAAAASLFGDSLVGTTGRELIVLYAVTLLLSTVDNTSSAVLQLMDRFSWVARYGLASEITRLVLVLVAAYGFGHLAAVLIALIIHDAIAAVVNTGMAARAFRAAAGRPFQLRRTAAAERRGFLRMVFHTNIIGYSRLSQTHLPTIVLGSMFGPLQVGVYKVGMAVASLLSRIGDPVYLAVLPRFARLWGSNERREILLLVKQTSLVGLPLVLVVAVTMFAIRGPLFRVFDIDTVSSELGIVLAFGLVAHGANSALFWNVPLITAAGRAGALSIASLISMTVFIPAPFLLSDAQGPAGAALALLMSFVSINLGMAWYALTLVKGAPAVD